MVNDQSANISYNAGTGEFTITAAGNYEVIWWVATFGAGTATEIALGVSLDGGPEVIGTSPSLTGQVVGHALITVTTTPATVTLNNVTGDSVFFAGTSVQADMLIEEVN